MINKTVQKRWEDCIGEQGLTPYYIFEKNKFAVMVDLNNKIDSIWDVNNNKKNYK